MRAIVWSETMSLEGDNFQYVYVETELCHRLLIIINSWRF